MEENIDVIIQKFVKKIITGNYTTEERLAEIKQITVSDGYFFEECIIEDGKFCMLFQKLADY